jgi:circadian clock protein KaiC
MKSQKNGTMTSRRSSNGQEESLNRPESNKEQRPISGRISTGVAELDGILNGGYLPRRASLVRGGPGCGKTSLGMHFLCAGAQRKEATLFVSLGESQDQLCTDAASIGLDMKEVAFLDLSVDSRFFTDMESYDLLDPIGHEAESYSQKIMRQIATLKPQRVFLDTMTQLRILSPDTFQFRKQVLAFLHVLT